MLAPIVLFAYKRPDEFHKTVQALQANYLADQSELYVFIDGPKHEADLVKVEQVRSIAKQISGFSKIHLRFSEVNLGCAKSIIQGVSEVLRKHFSVIVVEDDIVTSPNFLDFINQGLVLYKNNLKVFSIGGYTLPFKSPDNYSNDVYFYGRTCAWGWGIWADRWLNVDWSVTDYDQFMSSSAKRSAFNYYGSDRVRMLKRAINKTIDTWDIILCYEQFKRKQLTVYPIISKVSNIGFYSIDGSNTNVYNRYKTKLDNGLKRDFSLPTLVSENKYYTRQFRYKFSFYVRLFNRLKTIVGFR